MMIINIMKSKKGMVLPAVVAFILIFSIIGFSSLYLAATEVMLTQKETNSIKSFYLAEAGLARLTMRLHNRETSDIVETTLGEGNYKVGINWDAKPPYCVSIGKVRGRERGIKAELSFLARPYEQAIYAGNASGQAFTLGLRGQGIPKAVGGSLIGGKDIINGNIFVEGDVSLYQESSVNPSPLPNTYGLNGDVEATGKVSIRDSASVSGAAKPGVDPVDDPDLVGMDYKTNNTHNVSALFAARGVNSGRLPSGDELYNVFSKNPGDRASECATTVNDDYFMEPTTFITGADQTTAATPLHLGNNRIYYVDGDVWIHAKQTYGFLLDGKVTIVATGNIHICDNTKYADSQSLLGLVALGKYDDYGRLVSGGNIYFGDPRFGTMYTVSSLMFAANNFLYNTDSVTGAAGEPKTGFTVNGNFAALNQVSVQRDWYTEGTTGKAKPAYFNPATSQWVDLKDGRVLTSGEVSGMRHYQMQINYDERVRNPETQPPCLPKGAGGIFAGLTKWEEL